MVRWAEAGTGQHVLVTTRKVGYKLTLPLLGSAQVKGQAVER